MQDRCLQHAHMQRSTDPKRKVLLGVPSGVPLDVPSKQVILSEK